MAAYDTLRAAIDNYIKANGNKEITGTVLNDILNAMVSALGADTRFAGVAVPSTNPGNPEGNVVYFASQAGTYSNFGGIVLPLGIHILVWNGTAWTSQTWFSVDNTPTQNSQNLALSGGILQAIVDAVGVERLRAIGAEVTSCSFDGTTKKISFFNSANTTLFQLDATAFVIDGMVSDVKIEDGNLVIQFNTDAGKQDIEIPLTDIFNPANYYTKTAIDALLTAINNKLADGCLYRGMAEPTTNPPTPTTKVFYIATKAGTYTNFGNIAVTEGITILKYDGSSWSKEQVSYSDGVFDISAYNGTSYADLSAALGTNGANIPQNLRKGGMSVKYVQSSDNKYVQARLMAQNFTTDITQWQGIDDEPTAGSKNLVSSGGVVNNNIEDIKGYQLFSNAVAPFYYYLKNKYIDKDTGILTGGSDCATTNLIDITGVVKLKIKTTTPMKHVYGWRALAQDGETVLAFGTPADDTVTELNIDIKSNWKYIQYSEEKGIYETTTFFTDCNTLVAENEDAIYNLSGEITERFSELVDVSNKYIDPTTGQIATTGYDACLSNLINVHGSNLVRIISTIDLETVWGWRILAQDGETVLYYGGTLLLSPLVPTPPTSIKTIDINISDDAYYLQWSHSSSIYNNSFLVKKCPYNIGQVFSLIEKKDIAAKEFSANNITINANTYSVPVISPNDDNMASDQYDIVLNCKLNGNLGDGICIKLGNQYYGQSYLTITDTIIKEEYLSATNLRQYNHGLIIEDYLTVVLSRDFASNMYVRIMSKTGSFMQKLEVFDGTDGIEVTNYSNNSILIQKATRNYSRGLNRDILVFGDSYAHDLWGIVHQEGFNYSWTTSLNMMGAKFSNIGYPGGSPVDMLIRYISWGAKPKYIVFATGMNYSSDSDNTTPDNDFLSDLLTAKTIADSINAEFIPCTIPTVPNRNNNGKTYYIKQNFERYIDFEGCLVSNGEWKAGYLASDNIHPTALGFEAMITQVNADFPEIFVQIM